MREGQSFWRIFRRVGSVPGPSGDRLRPAVAVAAETDPQAASFPGGASGPRGIGDMGYAANWQPRRAACLVRFRPKARRLHASTTSL
jgi:hypothetical protein